MLQPKSVSGHALQAPFAVIVIANRMSPAISEQIQMAFLQMPKKYQLDSDAKNVISQLFSSTPQISEFSGGRAVPIDGDNPACSGNTLVFKTCLECDSQLALDRMIKAIRSYADTRIYSGGRFITTDAKDPTSNEAKDFNVELVVADTKESLIKMISNVRSRIASKRRRPAPN